MILSAGSRLCRYEILSALGAGGMGEVYKARDTRLERTMAVKLLPSHMSASSEVRQRFEREAKTISQLSPDASVEPIQVVLNWPTGLKKQRCTQLRGARELPATERLRQAMPDV